MWIKTNFIWYFGLAWLIQLGCKILSSSNSKWTDWKGVQHDALRELFFTSLLLCKHCKTNLDCLDPANESGTSAKWASDQHILVKVIMAQFDINLGKDSKEQTSKWPKAYFWARNFLPKILSVKGGGVPPISVTSFLDQKQVFLGQKTPFLALFEENFSGEYP